MWCRGQQKEVPSKRREKLTQFVPFGVFHLATKKRGRHLVGFIANYQVPATVGRLQFELNVFVTRELVQAGNNEVRFEEPVSGACCFQLVVREDFKWQMKALVQFILPLLGEAARAYNQAALQVATRQQFF